MSESTRNKIRYNIVPLDEDKITSDSYKLRSYTSASEKNPRDQFYRYEANRNDTNLFVSGTYNETRTQIHDAVYTEFKKGDINVIEFNESKNSLSIIQGYNTGEQKVYGYVFEKVKSKPTQTITFTQQQSMDLVSKTGMYIRNIKIYGSNIGVKNSYMPATIIAPSDFQGYRAQLSASGVTTAYDITKIHHEGDIKTSLQGPFTNQHVGGYAHRHQAINTGSDNSLNRLEMVSISASGNTINFTNPARSVKFSRDGGAKRFVNTRRIKTVDPRIAGNYSKNYEVFNATDRNENNLWLRSHPIASFPLIDSPYISGTQDFKTQDFTLGDGTNSKTIIAQTFGAPGGPETRAAQNLDPTSRQFSPYNTVNYRNPIARYYLNKKFLVNHAEYGNYTTAGYGLTASFHGVQRNTNYNIISSGGIVKKYDNIFVRREIPASPRGYSWIKSRFGTGSFDNNVFVKDYNNPGITFLSKSLDQNIYFENLSLNSTQEEIVKSSSFSAYSQSFNDTDANSLNVYLTAKNKLLGFGTQRQLSNYYNPIRSYTRKNNYVGDTNEIKQFIYFKHPPINSKYENVTVQFEMEDGSKEDVSLPFASNYAYLGDFYNTTSLKVDSLYKDDRNIKFVDKKDSLFFRILDNDNERRKNEINYPKINKINYVEKVWPKVEHSFTIRSTSRDTVPLLGNYWNNTDSIRINQAPSRYGIGPTFASINNNYSNVNTSSTGNLWQSYWPLDVYTTSSGNIFIDQSGVLMTLDNPTFVSANYPGVGFPNHLPSASYGYTEFGKFGRNFNINRPKNTVHSTANSFPYYQDYQQINYDIKNNFKGYGTLASYSSFLMLTAYYNEANKLADDYEYNSSYNQILNFTGDLDLVSDTFSLDSATGQPIFSAQFYEKYNYSDFIDVLPDFNQNEDLKISKLKINLNAVKKFFAFSNFYPSDFSIYTLARNFYLFYIGTYVNRSDAFELSSSNGIYSSADARTWAKPALYPFTSPGILYNSIKAGIAMPYNVVTSSVSASILINSLTGNYYKAPWETILDPSKIATIKMYDNDPDIQTPISAAATLQKGFQKDSAYKSLANNFFSEVIDFFLKDGILPRLKSKPQDSWYFPDITKDYSMKFVINKTNKFTTYSSLESFGPKPYIFHNPPWMTAGSDANILMVTNSAFNSDINLAPSASYSSASYALATITFKPSLITASAGVQIVAGKGSQFTFNEIKRYSTVTFENSFVTSSKVAQQAVNLGDCMELFGFSEDDKTWTPYVKWTCPTANLNFSGTLGKLSGSSTYDNGGSQTGDAIRGIWHQLGILPDESTGLFLQALDNSNYTTGSLLDIVGFNPKERVRIGEVANYKSFEEAMVIIPVYLENSIEEKLLYFDLDKFEKNYETEKYIKDIDLLSKNYVLPPLLDYMRVRRESKIPLSKRNYGNVTAPFLMFFTEFKTILSKDDLLKIWQGLTPAGSNTMEVDNKVIEFDLKNSNLFSYDDLAKFGNTLPKNLRFKIFKVYRRAETNYQNIINKTLGIPIKQNYKLTTNWPYSHAELVNMAEVKVELEYDKTFGVPKGSHIDSKGNIVKDTETNQ